MRQTSGAMGREGGFIGKGVSSSEGVGDGPATRKCVRQRSKAEEGEQNPVLDTLLMYKVVHLHCRETRPPGT